MVASGHPFRKGADATEGVVEPLTGAQQPLRQIDMESPQNQNEYRLAYLGLLKGEATIG